MQRMFFFVFPFIFFPLSSLNSKRFFLLRFNCGDRSAFFLRIERCLYILFWLSKWKRGGEKMKGKKETNHRRRPTSRLLLQNSAAPPTTATAPTATTAEAPATTVPGDTPRTVATLSIAGQEAQ